MTESAILIAPMRGRHLRGVVHIERATSATPWSTNLFAGELANPTGRCYVVALDSATVVGFGGLMFTGHEAHVTTLAVDPARRREQIATSIMLVLMGECRRRGVDDVTLEVRMSNSPAQELYRRFGFVPGGIRPRYYAESGEDALVMWANDLSSTAMSRRLLERAGELRNPLRTHPGGSSEGPEAAEPSS